MGDLLSIGLYTPTEAGRLLRITPQKISRWLRGHSVGDRAYPALWHPEVTLDDGSLYLGFRDLMEIRVADKLIGMGLSAQKVRVAIQKARTVMRETYPLSTERFQTDGRSIFLRIAAEEPEAGEREHLLNLFAGQYEFKQIIEPLLKTVDLDDKGHPAQWWPDGRKNQILVDPRRAFGQPIDAESSVPTAILAMAGERDGIQQAARDYDVSEAAVRRALAFEAGLEQRTAA